MTKCAIVRISDRRAEDSEEIRFANHLLEREIAKVFPEALFFDAGDKIESVGDTDLVLIIGDRQVFLSDTGLTRLRDLTLGNNGLAFSAPINAFAEIDSSEVRTLRGFQETENLLYTNDSTTRPSSALRAHRIPCLTGRVFRTLLGEDRDCEGLWSDWLEISEGIEADWAAVHLEFADYYGSGRRDLLPYVPRTAKTVLDVGCASGKTGKLIREGFNCRVSGIEPHPVAAALAKENLDHVYVGTLQDIDIAERFDLVIAADVIEHQRDFGEFLRQLMALTTPGGRVLLSIPNVGHHSIVGDLLAGRWDYVPIGLLCITHLRFFTRATLEDFLQMSGYCRYEIHPQPLSPLPECFQALSSHCQSVVNEESLRTPGFYVVIHANGCDSPAT